MKKEPAKRNAQPGAKRVPHRLIQDLASFRYQLRKFLRFSERAAISQGLTPQQHQLLLGVAGYNGARRATISDLAEFLQERHNSVVELVGRAVRKGLIRKDHDPNDRRYVYVSLTPRGEVTLAKLAELHRDEIVRLRAGLFAGGSIKNKLQRRA